MNETSLTVEHPSRRLVADLPGTFDEARDRYEQLVPEVDRVAFAAARSWSEQIEIAKEKAPLGFMRYGSIDIGPFMADSLSPGVATQYLMGNHTIAETMFRYDPAVMLHAPLRTLIYVSPDGNTRLALDQPSLLFGSYGDARISQVGRRLDSMVAELISALGADVPHELTGESA